MQQTNVDVVGRSLPSAKTYEKEYEYWPWGQVIEYVISWIRTNAPPKGGVVDYMCGTGLLLRELSLARRDLNISGCSITPDFISYCRQIAPTVNVECIDAFEFRPQTPVQVISCTGGLHHLSRGAQPRFLQKVWSELDEGGVFILGEELLPEWTTECERRSAVSRLGEELHEYILKRGAPPDVVAALQLMIDCELKGRIEFKSSMSMLLSMLEPLFEVVESKHFWPSGKPNFGDFVFICKKKLTLRPLCHEL